MAEPILLGWSGGKDSALALHALRSSSEYDVVGLLVTVTDEYQRVSMHGVRKSLVLKQAASIGLPLHETWISPGAGNAEYEATMHNALAAARARGIHRVAFGDLFLRDIRAYRERLLHRVGMECVFPIWERDTRELAAAFVADGFRAVLCCVDPRQVDASIIGRAFDDSLQRDLPRGADPCGENGEFHTFVFAGPILRTPIPLQHGDVVERDGFVFQDLLDERGTT